MQVCFAASGRGSQAKTAVHNQKTWALTESAVTSGFYLLACPVLQRVP